MVCTVSTYIPVDRSDILVEMDEADVSSDYIIYYFFFFQAEDGIRDLVRSRGLGDVYKRQHPNPVGRGCPSTRSSPPRTSMSAPTCWRAPSSTCCLLYTSDAADERSSVDLGGRRIIKKKKRN